MYRIKIPEICWPPGPRSSWWKWSFTTRLKKKTWMRKPGNSCVLQRHGRSWHFEQSSLRPFALTSGCLPLGVWLMSFVVQRWCPGGHCLPFDWTLLGLLQAMFFSSLFLCLFLAKVVPWISMHARCTPTTRVGACDMPRMCRESKMLFISNLSWMPRNCGPVSCGQ